MAARDEMLRRQRALADFGDFVLDHEDLDEILNEGCRLIAQALDVDLAKVIQIERETNTGLVRAGVGWRPGVVGHERIGLSERSSEAYAIEKTQPIITNDIAHEDRFEFPPFLREHGVIGLVNVPILLPQRRPWGVLQVDARRARDFDQADIEFLTTYAMVLGPVIDRVQVAAERKQALQTLTERQDRHEFLLALGDAMRSQTGATSKIEIAARMLGERMRAHRVLYAEYDHDRGEAHIFSGWFADGAQPFPTVMRLADYEGPVLNDLRAGGTVRVDDVGVRLDQPAYAAIAEVGVQALLSVPLIVDGTLAMNVSIHQHAAREWTDDEVLLVQEVAERLWAEVVRARREAALAASEAKYRTLFETMGQGYCELELVRDREGRAIDQVYLQLNPAFERLFGIPLAEAKGRKASEVFPTLEAYWTETFDRVARTGRSERIEKAFGTRWFEVMVYPETGDRLIVLYEDITDRKRDAEALRESEERLRQFGEASQDVLWIRDAETLQWTYLTPAFERIYGLAREDALTGDNYDNWRNLIVPEDRAKAEDAIAQVRRGEGVTFEYRIVRPSDGQVRWLRNTDFPIRDAAGRVTLIGGIGHDITERRQSDERQKLLLAELQHRVRNILAMVRSVARRTVQAAESVEDLGNHLDGRLASLARTQAMLTRAAAVGVDLETLIREELLAQNADEAAFTLRGPIVELAPKAAEVLTLAVHELATNATKYGAFAQPGAALEVRWSIEAQEDGPDQLRLLWQEAGVSLAALAPRRVGFGSELIQNRVPYELKGTGALEMRPGGICAEVTFPLVPGESILATSPPRGLPGSRADT